jgi:orotidine-5'-phosphate decarboxylase
MKFYDIGETVRRAVCQVARAGVQFLTVHGSAPVLRAAIEGRGTSSLKLLAVTVLTSYDQQDIEDLGYPCELSALVDLRSRRAMEAGVDGIVASPLDARRIRTIVGPGPLLITPGVRSAGSLARRSRLRRHGPSDRARR